MAGTIELGGKSYELKYNAYSFYKIMERTGKDLAYFMEVANGGGLAFALANIIWSGMAWNDEYISKLTPDSIARQLPLGEQMTELIALGEKVLDIFNKSMKPNAETSKQS